MNYTYRQLLEALLELSQEELDMNVSIYDFTNEVYYPLNYTGKTEGDDVLDADHPIMIINDPEDEDDAGAPTSATCSFTSSVPSKRDSSKRRAFMLELKVITPESSIASGCEGCEGCDG